MTANPGAGSSCTSWPVNVTVPTTMTQPQFPGALQPWKHSLKRFADLQDGLPPPLFPNDHGPLAGPPKGVPPFDGHGHEGVFEVLKALLGRELAIGLDYKGQQPERKVNGGRAESRTLI